MHPCLSPLTEQLIHLLSLCNSRWECSASNSKAYWLCGLYYFAKLHVYVVPNELVMSLECCHNFYLLSCLFCDYSTTLNHKVCIVNIDQGDKKYNSIKWLITLQPSLLQPQSFPARYTLKNQVFNEHQVHMIIVYIDNITYSIINCISGPTLDVIFFYMFSLCVWCYLPTGHIHK